MDEFPTKEQIREIMDGLVEELYTSWKAEMHERVYDLKLKGEICIQDLNVSKKAARLPNNFLRFALKKLETDLMVAGFECQFKFDDVESENWSLCYKLELADDDEEDDGEDGEEEDGEDEGLQWLEN